MPVTQPRPPNDNTPHPLAELPMAFAWSRCPRHPWLGVSVLVSPDGAPLCIGPEITHVAAQVSA